MIEDHFATGKSSQLDRIERAQDFIRSDLALLKQAVDRVEMKAAATRKYIEQCGLGILIAICLVGVYRWLMGLPPLL